MSLLKELLLRLHVRIMEELRKGPAVVHPTEVESTKTKHRCSLVKKIPFLFPSFLLNLNSDKSRAVTGVWMRGDPEEWRWTISSVSLLVFHPEQITDCWGGDLTLDGETRFILRRGGLFNY